MRILFTLILEYPPESNQFIVDTSKIVNPDIKHIIKDYAVNGEDEWFDVNKHLPILSEEYDSYQLQDMKPNAVESAIGPTNIDYFMKGYIL